LEYFNERPGSPGAVSEPRLDWSSAEVRGGKLSVSLEGDKPPGWRDTFEKTIQLLDGGDWEEINVKKHRVRVKGVTPGTEERLRHLLESAVLEANANHIAADQPSGDEPEEQTDSDEDPEGSPDAEMTERFRSFATQL
jgi:hypothetical protein